MKIDHAMFKSELIVERLGRPTHEIRAKLDAPKNNRLQVGKDYIVGNADINLIRQDKIRLLFLDDETALKAKLLL